MPLKLAVLVVGSLYWEGSDDAECVRIMKKYGYPQTDDEKRKIDIRRNWRRNFLSASPEDTQQVLVPIRYGRKSASRGDSYSMVFSPEYANHPGTAKAIKCSAAIADPQSLIHQAEELWISEDGKIASPRRVSAGWGCIVLLVHPKFLDHPDRAQRAKLLDDWADRVRMPAEPHYGKLGLRATEMTDEFKARLARGQLQIAWPQLVGGGDAPFDLMLATATNPDIGKVVAGIRITGYPDPATIARAWITNNNRHGYYFWCNQASEITTADDDEIKHYLPPP